MNLELIDIGTYNRYEHFRHFMAHKCSITISTDIEISKLCKFIKKNNLKTYPVLIWVVSNAVNTIPEFRLTLVSNDKLAFFNQIDPAYIAWNNDTKTIYCLSTPFTRDFMEFYKNCLYDIESNKNKSMFPQGRTQPNIFSISANSKIRFTNASINVHRQPLSPIITLGRIYKKWFKSYIPISIQVNHANCDGYHITLFFNEIKKTINTLI